MPTVAKTLAGFNIDGGVIYDYPYSCLRSPIRTPAKARLIIAIMNMIQAVIFAILRLISSHLGNCAGL